METRRTSLPGVLETRLHDLVEEECQGDGEEEGDRAAQICDISSYMVQHGVREEEGEIEGNYLHIDAKSFKWTCDVKIQI